ncbi:MAG: hypothetical protein IJW67_05870 [Blautia sp.]|nr:hypothetical protein [Blautia sp.]
MSIVDWRAPLYENVLQMEEKFLKKQDIHIYHQLVASCTFLGDYRDVRQRLAQIQSKKDQMLLKLYNDVDLQLKTCSGSEDAAKVLSSLELIDRFQQEDPDVVLDLEKKKEKAQRLWKTYKKKETLKERRRQFWLKRKRQILAGSVVAAVFLLVVLNRFLPGYILGQAKNAYERGEYQSAVSRYRLLLRGKYQEEAKEGMQSVLNSWGDWLVENGAYALAIDKYGRAGEEDKIIDTETKWAFSAAEDQNYLLAISKFQKLNMDEEVDHTYLLWGEALARDGKYADAILTIRKAAMSQESEKRIAELYPLRDEMLTEEFLALDTPTPEMAKQIGLQIDDINGQLSFCKVLYEAGCDLSEVYPEGVKICDLKLAAYQMTAQEMTDIPKERMLVLKRKEVDEPYSTGYTINKLANEIELPDKSDDNIYEIYLLPAELYQIEEEKRAVSWEDCKSFVLADSIFRYEDLIKGTMLVNEESNLPSEMRDLFLYKSGSLTLYYPSFSVVDSVGIFEKDHPECVMIEGQKKSFPDPSEDDRIITIYEADGSLSLLLGNRNKLLGESDTEWLKQATEQSVQRVNAW